MEGDSPDKKQTMKVLRLVRAFTLEALAVSAVLALMEEPYGFYEKILGERYADVLYQLASCLYLEIAIDELIPYRSASSAIVFTILWGERLLQPTFKMASIYFQELAHSWQIHSLLFLLGQKNILLPQ